MKYDTQRIKVRKLSTAPSRGPYANIPSMGYKYADVIVGKVKRPSRVAGAPRRIVCKGCGDAFGPCQGGTSCPGAY